MHFQGHDVTEGKVRVSVYLYLDDKNMKCDQNKTVRDANLNFQTSNHQHEES